MKWKPVFDTTDIARYRRDQFIARSNVPNEAEIRWLGRHLGDCGLRLHRRDTMQPTDAYDTTFVPLAPGRVLIRPVFIDTAFCRRS